MRTGHSVSIGEGPPTGAEVVLDAESFWDKGFEWILSADGSDEIIIGGYTTGKGNPLDEGAVYIVEPAWDCAVKWSHRWDERRTMGPAHSGTFGMGWDRENTLDVGRGYRQARQRLREHLSGGALRDPAKRTPCRPEHTSLLPLLTEEIASGKARLFPLQGSTLSAETELNL